MTPYVIILVTTPSEKWAKKIARYLVRERYVACVNPVRSNPLGAIPPKAGWTSNGVNIIPPITKGSRPYLNWLGSVTTDTHG